MALKLPKFRLPSNEWPAQKINEWQSLVQRAENLQKGAGKGGNFEQVVQDLRYAISDKVGTRIKRIISTRIGARAITYLWLEDSSLRNSLNPRSLALLIECQQPRLSQIPLINLVDLYFRYFDQLGLGNQSAINQPDMQPFLSEIISDQLRLLPDNQPNHLLQYQLALQSFQMN